MLMVTSKGYGKNVEQIIITTKCKHCMMYFIVLPQLNRADFTRLSVIRSVWFGFPPNQCSWKESQWNIVGIDDDIETICPTVTENI